MARNQSKILYELLSNLFRSQNLSEVLPSVVSAAAAAVGAKLTGAGGGGAMIALAPEEPERVAQAIRTAGYRSFLVRLGAEVTS